jgi:hypothetical protein
LVTQFEIKSGNLKISGKHRKKELKSGFSEKHLAFISN